MSDSPAITDPGELRDMLCAGDTLVKCNGLGWHLARSGMPVDPAAVEVLNMRLDSGPGGLVALDDGLPGLGMAQSFVWRT